MIALTFDTDWMEPDDLERFLDEYPFPGRGTLFLHRPFRFLRSTTHELCPHPCPVGPDEWKASIRHMLDQLGVEPTGVRTHSAIHSHRLEMALFELGFKYTSNTSRLFERDIRPVRLAWGLWEFPIYYMDNLDLTMEEYWKELPHKPLADRVVAQALQSEALHVFDFHPLHVCLNTPSLAFYLQQQDKIRSGTSPFDLQYAGRGVGTLFRELCRGMEAGGQPSQPLIEVRRSLPNQPESAVVAGDSSRGQRR
ncbi:MAG: hypothetical protein V3R16_01010 [Nitrospirales bacterium]